MIVRPVTGVGHHHTDDTDTDMETDSKHHGLDVMIGLVF